MAVAGHARVLWVKHGAYEVIVGVVVRGSRIIALCVEIKRVDTAIQHTGARLQWRMRRQGVVIPDRVGGEQRP